jgi:hypothetical protein
VTRNWTGFWLSSAMSALIILLLVAAFFRDHSRIETKQAEQIAA